MAAVNSRLRHILRAIVFDWLHQPERALAAYTEAFRAGTGDVRSARSIAWILGQQGRWRDAEAWLVRALEISGRHADTWFNLGYAREKSGNLQGALEAFRRATEIDPDHDLAWYGQGLLHVRMCDHATAALALSRAAKLNPMNGEVWYTLGLAWHRCNEPDRVKVVVEHCVLTAPAVACRLVKDTVRSDLIPLVAHLRERKQAGKTIL